MKMHLIYIIYKSWLILSAICVICSATDEHLNLEPIFKDDQFLLSNEKNLQQFMQNGGILPSSGIWYGNSKNMNNLKSEISKLNNTYVYQPMWPNDLDVQLGAVTAVDFDKDGNVVLFHRVDRVWEQHTFDDQHRFQQQRKGAISDCTVLALDRATGKLIYCWGKNLFYMPHGLTIDNENNVWVTDVALHQVFKFGPRGSNDKPLMTLGSRFMPGMGDKFCKPTSVAVLDNGDFFIADGYCNARILKYSKEGKKILSWGENAFSGRSVSTALPNFFAIPHALALVPEQELLCVADRENGRIQCFYWSNGKFHSQYHSPLMGDRLFSLDYTPAEGGRLIIVNGPTSVFGADSEDYNEVRGYVFNMKENKVVGKFGPNNMQFANPHDVAVTTDGKEVYVAELNPMRLHKFLHKSIAKSITLSTARSSNNIVRYEISKEANSRKIITNHTSQIAPLQAVVSSDPHIEIRNSSFSSSSKNGGHSKTNAILVVSLMLSFALFTFAVAILLARRRKRGCSPFDINKEHLAWEFPSRSSESFHFAGLLMERNRREGFQKLDQSASDEETEPSTNLSSTRKLEFA